MSSQINLAVVVLVALLAGAAAIARRRRAAARAVPSPAAPPATPPAGPPARRSPRPTRATPAPERIELSLSAGRLAAQAWGSSGELVLCLPGLAATSGTFAAVAPALAEDHRVVALDLRGRGRSDATPPGSYGWQAHARDALEAASALGADRFVVIGHSMGAYVAMQAAALAPGRLAAAVLIDSAGTPDTLAASGLLLSSRGVTAMRPTAEEHVRAFRDSGMVQPWSAVWERALRDDLVASPEGVRRRTSGAAVTEDVGHAMTRQPRLLWDALDMPALLVRATRPTTRLGGFVVPERERDAMGARLRQLQVLEVDANHLGALTHPATVAGIRDFLTATAAERQGALVAAGGTR